MRPLTKDETEDLKENETDTPIESLVYDLATLKYMLGVRAGMSSEENQMPEKSESVVVDIDDIIFTLQHQYNVYLTSDKVFDILKNMGMIEPIKGWWRRTDKGEEYSVFKTKGHSIDIWTDNIIQDIADYIGLHPSNMING